jgi:hypothetical protein
MVSADNTAKEKNLETARIVKVKEKKKKKKRRQFENDRSRTGTVR